MNAFCDGVNDYVKQMKVLPLEFWLTWQSFDEWKRSDSFRLTLMMNIFLALDFLFEPFKELVRHKYGRDFADEVLQGFKNIFTKKNSCIRLGVSFYSIM